MDGLIRRVEALGASGPINLLKVADLQMNVLRRRVTRAGPRITLSP
jgi:hypothetical protein